MFPSAHYRTHLTHGSLSAPLRSCYVRPKLAVAPASLNRGQNHERNARPLPDAVGIPTRRTGRARWRKPISTNCGSQALPTALRSSRRSRRFLLGSHCLSTTNRQIRPRVGYQADSVAHRPKPPVPIPPSPQQATAPVRPSCCRLRRPAFVEGLHEFHHLLPQDRSGLCREHAPRKSVKVVVGHEPARQEGVLHVVHEVAVDGSGG